MARPKIFTDEEIRERRIKHDRERKKSKREEWKKNGLCIMCGNPQDTHRLKCQACYEKTLHQENKIRNKSKLAGICTECHRNPSYNGYVVCEQCHAEAIKKNRRNRINRNKVAKSWRDRVWADVINAYGGKCACCGETEPMFLEVDHVKNNGSSHRKTIKGGSQFHRWLQKEGYPKDDYQLLCRNCNYGKFRNGGICPHKKAAVVDAVTDGREVSDFNLLGELLAEIEKEVV